MFKAIMGTVKLYHDENKLHVDEVMMMMMMMMLMTVMMMMMMMMMMIAF
jgi:hypothetical protein